MYSRIIQCPRQSVNQASFFSPKYYSVKTLPSLQKTILLSGPGNKAFNNKTILKLENALIKQSIGPVIRIGDGESGLTENDFDSLLHEISNNKMRIILFLMAHGTIDRASGDHMLYLKSNDIPTTSIDFMESISTSLQRKAIEVFSTACHGGALNPYVGTVLPKGSTYVSLSPANQPTSGSDVNRLIDFLTHNCKVQGNLTAEKILISYLTKALKNRVPPFITSSEISSNLHNDFLNHIGVKFSETEKELIYRTLGDQTNNEKLNHLMCLIERANDEPSICAIDYGLALAICYAASGKVSLEYIEGISKPNENRVSDYIKWR